MKKLLALLLALVMVLSMAACGGTPNETTAPKQDETKPAGDKETTAPAVSRGDLKNAEVYPLDVADDVVFDVIAYAQTFVTNDSYGAKLWEEVTGVKINYLDWTEEQYGIALRDNDLPDACYRNYGLTKAGAYEMGQAGKLVNFMDYLDIMPNLAKFLEDYPAAKLAAMNEDGTMYCLPTVIKTSGSQPNLLYVRTDMAEAAGWTEMPTTVEELLEMAKDIQETYKDVEGFHAFDFEAGVRLEYNSPVPELFLASFGELLSGDITADRSGKVVFGAGTEQYKHYLEWMNEMWESGACATEFYADDGTLSKAARASNKIAISITYGGFSLENFESGEYELVVLEPLTSQYWNEKHWRMRQDGTFHNSWISTSCEDIETMCIWFDSFFATEEDPLNEEGTVWSLSAWLGEKGVIWDTVSEGSTGFKWVEEDGTYPQTMYYPFLGKSDYYMDDPNNLFSLKCKGTKENLWPYAEYDPVVKQLPLSTEDQDTVDSKMADIYKYVNESIAQFIAGKKDIATEWDSYVATLEKMGINDVCAIYQTYYNEYNAE